MNYSCLPLVSVILPVRNEEAYIARSLGSIFAQDYPANRLEILIVDGMSVDGTREVVRQMMSERGNFLVSIIDNPKLITAAALNIGICNARGEIIIRVDGHCEIESDYIRHCVYHLQKDGVEGVGGTIETKGETYSAQAIAIGTSSTFGVGNSSFRIEGSKQQFTDSVPFPAYNREIFNFVGYYDEEMLCNEDDEYNYRVRAFGGRILLACDVSSRYYCRNSLYALWKQQYRFGLWKIRVMQKHARQMSARQFVPAAFVMALLCSVLIYQFPFLRPLSYGIPLLYFCVNILASTYTAFKRGWRYLLFLPLVFATIHLSYGFGFLIGMLKFANLWDDRQVIHRQESYSWDKYAQLAGSVVNAEKMEINVSDTIRQTGVYRL